MIRTKLSYSNQEMYIRPETISYITRIENETVIGFTNGHTYNVTASPLELLEVLENEKTTTKSDS